MDAFLLICELHNLLLRELSKDAGMQFQGLQQAARFYRLKKRLGLNRAKKLANFDVAFNIMRHLTKPGLQEFACGIFSAISQGTAEDPKDERDQRDEASEHVKTDAADGQKGKTSGHNEKVATNGLGKKRKACQ